ncbi:MAG TPA: hypothetical protein VLJ37_07915 [bacterium]|nr:hypothetical protein [bacterium]
MTQSSIRPLLFAALALILVEAPPPLSAEASNPLASSAESVIRAKLVEPLQKKEEGRSRFSRAVSAPHARRIRILDDTPHTDRVGRRFLPFAIDERRAFGAEGGEDGTGSDWLKDALTGCVYPESGEVMVRRGDVYYASSVLLGRPTPTAPADVCRPL